MARQSPDRSQGRGSHRPVRPGGFGRGPGAMGMPIVRAKNPVQTLKRLWRYLAQDKWLLIGTFLAVMVSSLSNLAGPYLIGVAIDNYIIPGDFRGLLFLCLSMIGIYLLNTSSTWLQNYWMIGIAQNTVMKIRRELFFQLQDLPLSFLDKQTHGDVMSRLTNDVENVSNTLNMGVTQVFASAITIVGTLAMMFWLSPMLTLITLVIIPFMVLATRLIAKYTRKFFAEQQEHMGELNGLVEEAISGQRVVKVFRQEQNLIKKFSVFNEQLRNAGAKAQIFSGLVGPIMNVFNNLSFAVLAGVGGWLALQGIVTVGVIASFANYSRQFTRPINELANQFNMVQQAIAGAERCFELIDEEPEPIDSEDAPPLEITGGEVVFENVSFSYDQETPVLKNVNLHVKPGETVALVGPTGAGKTTIINLLTRFYDIDQGRITIDGQDIRYVQRKSLRSALGIVLQDTYLFSESVRENIRYGRLDATDGEVEEAARLAYADQFIKRLPQGYDTVLSEDGGDLSQGQRQLLAIARAILANPAILILDEATSSVDTRTEIHIQQAMLNLMKGRTCFVIAHRLSTIRDADKIVVIHDGQAIEQGTHQELLDKRGFYFNLYQSQFSRLAS